MLISAVRVEVFINIGHQVCHIFIVGHIVA